MSLKLMFITNRDDFAMIADKSGVDWVFIDLEINGKVNRQGHLDTVISRHNIDDVSRIKKILTNSKLLVRVNPIYKQSKQEIDRVIQDGADIVMLPFFKTKNEVEQFVNHINGRAKVCILCETAEAVKNIDAILSVSGIDYIHIGLNDLHLSYNMKFMFELLVDGTVESLCNKFKQKGIPYGFGGIAKLGQGALPAENILSEHYRLGSSMVILSRSFSSNKESEDINKVENIFKKGIQEIRNYENMLCKEPKEFFEKNQQFLYKKVKEIVYSTSK